MKFKHSLLLGKVPECESELRKITGVGPVMADLLAFVNNVEAHALCC